MTAMNPHSHKRASSFQEVGHGCRRKDMSQHGHENVMDHKLPQYTNYKSAKYQQKVRDN